MSTEFWTTIGISSALCLLCFIVWIYGEKQKQEWRRKDDELNAEILEKLKGK
jgi:cbb3-type cytochrome oxidase subunit 3